MEIEQREVMEAGQIERGEKDVLMTHRSDRQTRLDNLVCPYCGKFLEDSAKSKEHVIGRKFTPLGKLENRWNLILWACKSCNGGKANLEDDISAISLSPFYAHPDLKNDADLEQKNLHKSTRSMSRRTGKAVIESAETLSVEIPLSSKIHATFGMIAPPQVDRDRAFMLARGHLSALFYMMTYQPAARRGFFWPEKFQPEILVHRADWGHPTAIDFADTVLDWPPKLILDTADGYFRACIKRHPSHNLWSWALEWNRAFRLIGFFGDEKVGRQVSEGLKRPEVAEHKELDGRITRVRFETQLGSEVDNLFVVREV